MEADKQNNTTTSTVDNTEKTTNTATTTTTTTIGDVSTLSKRKLHDLLNKTLFPIDETDENGPFRIKDTKFMERLKTFRISFSCKRFILSFHLFFLFISLIIEHYNP